MSDVQQWLWQLVGEWTYELRTADDSDHPGVLIEGTESVRAIGDTWIVSENKGKTSDGDDSHTITIIGYEPEKKRFTGAVAGTAVPTLFVYDGSLGEDGTALMLETEGPAMSEGNDIDRYRDIICIVGHGDRETIAQVLAVNGEWREFMRTKYHRVV